MERVERALVFLDSLPKVDVLHGVLSDTEIAETFEPLFVVELLLDSLEILFAEPEHSDFTVRNCRGSTWCSPRPWSAVVVVVNLVNSRWCAAHDASSVTA
eukprot:CAMPEP_0182932844 /NCGR_PEP_ID=MMETSP0105_2-20130417/32392_1 /TAXON_ID=81532 ORGANISM="Acanthoeca-like sp., Strain 10tr" /NCGR_SAMPLE_ID=MMETSP0105_2 /ASSEMBLY_ACC=CAM_ASM_000205 /LENGTH=99 /DNA_ID=CAMNT_0025071501 /DNA_START=269 /DNA_END=564 /DNA_ORIENTATION=+